MRKVAIWAALAAACLIPIAISATSPQLQWRGPVYIAAGFAGIIAMTLLLVQPLLAQGYLPGLSPRRTRQVHRWVGTSVLTLVVLHVAALWWTSPPDVMDALLFRSPTPFSLWGVIAMWAVFVTALIAATRRRFKIGPGRWRMLHLSLAVVIISGSIAHALLIDGTMGTVSKVILCFLVAAAAIRVLLDTKPWRKLGRS